MIKRIDGRIGYTNLLLMTQECLMMIASERSNFITSPEKLDDFSISIGELTYLISLELDLRRIYGPEEEELREEYRRIIIELC